MRTDQLSRKHRRTALATALVAVAVGLSSMPTAGQPREPEPETPYDSLPTAAGAAPAQVQAPTAEEAAAEARRTRRVAARAGEVEVTVGEIEHYLAGASPSEVVAFGTPAGRRGIVGRLLRNHLLAVEAERRGSLDGMLAFRARRREERVLRDLLEQDVRRSPGAIPPPSEPVNIPEERFAVILRTTSREAAQEWAAAVRGESYQTALQRGEPLGEVQQTPYGVAGQPPETSPPIEPSLWRTLFTLEPHQPTPPIAIGGGRWASVSLVGITGGYVDTGPDEGARRMLAGDQAWSALREQVRADLVSDYNPSGLDGVLFRLPDGVTPAQQRALAAEAEATRRRAELAEEGARQ